VLLEGGRLVDTTLGETVPDAARRQQPPTEAEIAALATPPREKLARCVARAAELRGNPASPLARDGVEECAVITPTMTADGFAPGPIAPWWPHGFNLRCLKLRSGAAVPRHRRAEAEVIFVHRGVLEVSTPDGAVLMGPGDTFTTPRGTSRAFRATSSEDVEAYVVRGGDSPAPPEFVS
jgi:mannose-6-phosphate isomerase-like protein (cupin superfamily)